MQHGTTVARGLLIYLASLPLMLSYGAAQMPELEVLGLVGFIAAILLAITGSTLIFRVSSDSVAKRGFGGAIAFDSIALALAAILLMVRFVGAGEADLSFLMYLEPLAFHIFGLITFMLGLSAVSSEAGRPIQLGRLYRFLGICLVGGFLLLVPGVREKVQLPLLVLVVQLGLIYPILVVRSAVVRSGST